MRAQAQNPQLLATINVTPIIDVALVLVIILLVTAPMMSVTNMPVRLPLARTRGAEDQRNVSVTLGSDGSLAVDATSVTEPQIASAVAASLAKPGNAGVLVVIRADAAAPYGRVRQLLHDVRAAGAKRVAIATEQRGEATP